MDLMSSVDSDHELADELSGDDNNGEDNDLTNLTWLQDRNLLQNIQVCTNQSIIGDHNEEDNENVSPSPQPEDIQSGNGNDDPNHHKNITTVPPVTYNPHLHRNAKPPYSFSSLIFMAIESSPNKALPVKDIYQWIVEHYPYYQTAPSGWKNTVRHNLSLNKCFRKLDKSNDELIPIVGKGSLWCVDPDLRPNLLQAVRRTPAHIYPYMSLAKAVVAPPRIQLSSNSNNATQQQVKKALSAERVQSVVNIPSPNLFPFLSRRLLIPITKIMKNGTQYKKETDAAVSMLTLQCNVANNSIGDDVIQENSCELSILPDSYVDDLDAPVVTVTVSPTNDHNYYQRNSSPQVYQLIQLCEESGLEEQNSGSHKRKQTKNSEIKKEDEDSNDEGMRGAEALLNLASSNSNKQQTQQQQQHERPIILKKCKKE